MSDQESNDAQFDTRMIVRKVILGLLVLTLIFALIAFVFRDEMFSFSEWFVVRFGLWGVGLGFFFPDLLALPVPQDAFVGFAVFGGLNAFVVGATAAVGSLSGGTLAYVFGRRAVSLPWAQRMLQGEAAQKAQALVRRYGLWALAIGALTPLPYSIFCWSCGAMRIRFVPFILTSLLRIPRIFFYLWLMQMGFLQLAA